MIILVIEQDYDGPHLEADGRVTKDFMFALLPFYESQKKLHKKYTYQVINLISTVDLIENSYFSD